VRIDELEKMLMDSNDHSNQRFNETRDRIRNEINQLREENSNNLKCEIEGLKSFVQMATDKVNTNNDGIYEKYDEKLRKIKEVCASYFSKYEKHLLNQQTLVKDLERQQQQWVQMLLKPQELNQARLFAVETRIKESEENKLRDVDFLKETIKKLIFALE
jgi:hypothetical protein